MGWTHDERLVALNEEGTYRIHDLSGAYTQHSLGTDAADIGIQDARIHEHGLVALTNQLTFLEVKAWTGTKPLALALPDPSLDGAPHGWSIVPPDATISRHIEVLVASGNTILSVDALECVDQRVGRGPFLSIAPSPNGKSIALLTSSGLVWVVSADFTKSYAGKLEEVRPQFRLTISFESMTLHRIVQRCLSRLFGAGVMLSCYHMLLDYWLFSAPLEIQSSTIILALLMSSEKLMVHA
jgi:hypothetical protein